MNSVGHIEIFAEYPNIRKKDGVNGGKAVKYLVLNEAHTLKTKLAGGDTNSSKNNKIVRQKRDILNQYIMQIQRDINDGTFVCETTVTYLDQALFPHSRNDTQLADIRSFIQNVAILAKHNTTSNTKTNWFGVINKTDHIGLLLNGKKCQNYLNGYNNNGGTKVEKMANNGCLFNAPDMVIDNLNISSAKSQAKFSPKIKNSSLFTKEESKKPKDKNFNNQLLTIGTPTLKTKLAFSCTECITQLQQQKDFFRLNQNIFIKYNDAKYELQIPSQPTSHSELDPDDFLNRLIDSDTRVVDILNNNNISRIDTRELLTIGICQNIQNPIMHAFELNNEDKMCSVKPVNGFTITIDLSNQEIIFGNVRLLYLLPPPKDQKVVDLDPKNSYLTHDIGDVHFIVNKKNTTEKVLVKDITLSSSIQKISITSSNP